MYYSYIYITINQLENKCYVGKKLGLPEESKSYLGSGKILKRKVKTYGKQFFKKIILGILKAENLEELSLITNEAEIEAVWSFRAYGSDGEHHDHIYGYNLTKGGDGTFCLPEEIQKKKGKKISEKRQNETEEQKQKRINNFKKKLEAEPEIWVDSGKKSSQTKKDNPEIVKNAKKKEMETKRNNPEIMENAGKKHSITYQNKTKEEKQNIINKFLKTLEDDPSIVKNKTEKRLKTLKENPEIGIQTNIKISETIIKNKITGKKHPCYIELDYEFLIREYFNLQNIKTIINKYNKLYTTKISESPYDRFLKILNFPRNCLGKTSSKIKIQIYLKFVEENKNKIQWYIDNYERLEEEYFNNQWKERHSEFIDKY